MSNIPASSQPDLCIEIISDSRLAVPVERERIETAVRAAADDQGYNSGEIGIRITDDSIIRQLNRTHLNHDYATDVISFPYSRNVPSLHGEMVVSVDTAMRQADELGWPAEFELLLYVVHGTLHLAGLDDQSEMERVQMRKAEQRVMRSLGIEHFERFSPGQPLVAQAMRAKQ